MFKFVAAMLAVLLQSCADEAICSVDGVEEGRAATVSLKWDLETVEHKSRTASDVFFSGYGAQNEAFIDEVGGFE